MGTMKLTLGGLRHDFRSDFNHIMAYKLSSHMMNGSKQGRKFEDEDFVVAYRR